MYKTVQSFYIDVYFKKINGLRCVQIARARALDLVCIFQDRNWAWRFSSLLLWQKKQKKIFWELWFRYNNNTMHLLPVNCNNFPYERAATCQCGATMGDIVQCKLTTTHPDIHHWVCQEFFFWSRKTLLILKDNKGSIRVCQELKKNMWHVASIGKLYNTLSLILLSE